ncbi:uncharacterized protein EI97DRAFT_457915 [Westerdykella ornata]|uniref:Uncharacterized protein n=1 Tax=Westerdykella ornata TaxID=318751 RepID=A0A6A6JMP4_WESOR|nr:uncharacterized protein EI97DRAFT_457915 [Westerdykella ornata]KAF2277208.1 hypothetical protein EI97DRAFT_457915 [Westerdykella ornata]
MFTDVDYVNPETQEDVKNWGIWITKESGVEEDWVAHVRAHCGADVFMVGEYWVPDVREQLHWLEIMQHDDFNLFDSDLVFNFSRISKNQKADLRQVFDNTLVQKGTHESRHVGHEPRHAARPDRRDAH